jgi:diacylglycerol O-acyltransferase-1
MLLEGLVEATLIYAAFKQFILPVLTESPPATHSHIQEKGGAERARRVVGLFLDVLRLSIPSMLVWLACFDLYFNRLLQAQAELLMYKERRFNGPFWNSTSLSSFWRTWNIPVHEWAFEHVFKSMRTQSVPREVAVLFTFLLSAMLHEVIFSVAFKTIRPYFFIGMLLQVPLVLFTHSLKGTRRGNLIVWLSLFCGHPLLEILYLREYLKNHDMFCVK